MRHIECRSILEPTTGLFMATKVLIYLNSKSLWLNRGKGCMIGEISEHKHGQCSTKLSSSRTQTHTCDALCNHTPYSLREISFHVHFSISFILQKHSFKVCISLLKHLQFIQQCRNPVSYHQRAPSRLTTQLPISAHVQGTRTPRGTRVQKASCVPCFLIGNRLHLVSTGFLGGQW